MPPWLESLLSRKTPSVREQALLYLRQRNWDRALLSWQELLEEEPENKGVITTVAELYLKKEERDRAFNLIEKVVQLYLAEGKLDQAAALLRRVAQLVPTDLTPRERLIKLFAKAYEEAKGGAAGNRYRDQALVELRALVAMPATLISEKVRLDYLRSISRLDPRDFGTVDRIITIMKARGRHLQARDFLLETAERLIKRKWVAAAEKVIHEGLKLDPGNVDFRAFFFLAQVYKGFEQQAVQSLERMHLDQPTNLAVVLALARAAKAMKRPRVLADWLIEAFKLDSEQAQVLVENALRLLDQGEIDQAFRLCEVLALSEWKKGNVPLSVSLLERLIKKDPNHLPARQALVRYCMHAGQRIEAGGHLEHVHRLLVSTGNEPDFQVYLLEILTEFPGDSILTATARRLRTQT